MKLRFKRWITPPIFEHDDSKTYRARLLNAILIGIVALASIALVGGWLGGRTPATTLTVDFLVCASCALLWYAMRRGQVALSSIGLLAAGLISITAGVASLGTVRSPAASLFLLLVITGGLLFDLPGILVTTGLSSLSVLGLIFTENAGLLPPADRSVTITQWLIYTALFGVCGGLTFYSIESTRHALKRADQELVERQRTEDHIRTLNRELERHAAELQVANNELESFSFSISHDLRTPLASITNFSSRLLEDDDRIPPDARRLVELIQGNSAAMTQLVEGLLQFSRSIRQPLHRQTVDMNGLVGQVLGDLHAQQQGRTIELSIGQLPSCQADPLLLKQVWMNLLSNALKFTRQRPVARIEIDAKPAQEGATIYSIRDNGVGFDPKQADRLFAVFQRLHREDEYEGTGVGLAIAERIIRRHGGQLRAEGQVDQGATFYFSLPA